MLSDLEILRYLSVSVAGRTLDDFTPALHSIQSVRRILISGQGEILSLAHAKLFPRNQIKSKVDDSVSKTVGTSYHLNILSATGAVL